MALTKFTTDVKNHQALSDRPNANEGITASELKVIYDKAAEDIKDYINDELTVEIDVVDTGNVKLTGNQTVAGIKTFTSSPVIPDATSPNQASSKGQLDTHIADNTNPHSVTKSQVGLSNVDNTSDLNKPVSTATQSALDLKGNITYIDAQDDALQSQITANNNNAVKITGDQTIAGTKEFTSNVEIPLEPSLMEHATSKRYVDTEISDAVFGILPDPEYSLILTSKNAVTPLPTGSLNGKMLYEANGLSVVQSVVNGDISDGTNNWDGLNGVLSVSGDDLMMTVSNPLNSPRIEQNPDLLPNEIGEKWFLYGAVGDFSFEQASGGSYLQLGASSTPVFYNSIGEETEVYGIVETADTTSPLRFFVSCISGVAGSTFKYRGGNAGVFAINMTALGIEDYTTSEMLDLARSMDAGSTDIQNVNLDIENVGKNLFNNENIEDLYNISWADTSLAYKSGKIEFVSDGGESTFSSKRTLKIEANTNCKISLLNLVENIGDVLLVYTVDGVDNFIGTSATFSSVEGEVTIGLASTGGNTAVNASFNIQLEYGSTATEYQPYFNSQLTFPTELKSVPNGVSDELFNYIEDSGVPKALDGTYHAENVEEQLLVNGDLIAYVADYSGSGFDRLAINKPTDYIGYNNLSLNDGSMIVKKYPNLTFSSSIEENTINNSLSATTYSLILPSGTYTHLAAAQADLAGTVINYQLAIPIVEKVEINDIQSYEDGTQYNNSSVLGSMDISTPQNLKAVVEGNTQSIKQLNDKTVWRVVDVDIAPGGSYINNDESFQNSEEVIVLFAGANGYQVYELRFTKILDRDSELGYNRGGVGSDTTATTFLFFSASLTDTGVFNNAFSDINIKQIAWR